MNLFLRREIIHWWRFAGDDLETARERMARWSHVSGLMQGMARSSLAFGFLEQCEELSALSELAYWRARLEFKQAIREGH